MNCKNCGAELDEGAIFCGNCGVKIETEQPVVEEPVQEECNQECCVAPVIPEEPKSAAVPAEKPNTVLWIVLAAVEIFTCCQITGIVSLIFAILGHLAADKGDFANAEKKIKAAKISFWIGFAVGLIVILAYLLIFALGFASGITEEMFNFV